MARKKVEEIYKSMTEIEHVLHRPGMWVGSTKEEEKQMFVYDEDSGKMTMRTMTYVPAMLKIFDEVLSNSCDEYRRSTNMGLDKIEVTIDKCGQITVMDNGGIPIVMHKDAGCYVPEFIFGRLRTSSNYDDTEDRQLIGTNGVGSSIANIFSSKFVVESCDTKNKFHRSWSNNMQKLNDDLRITPCKQHYTKTTFNVDFDKFDVNYNEFTNDFIDIVEKRCIDASVANPGLKIVFTYIKDKKTVRESTWKFKKFENYIELFSDFIDIEHCISFKDDDKKVWIYPDGNLDVGFVDGAECSKGTHINAIRFAINTSIMEHLAKKKKIEVTRGNINNKYSMFCDVTVSNPAYNSQTKEELTTPVNKFSKSENYEFVIPEDFLTKCCRSEITDIVLDWYNQKKEADDARAIRKINREARKLLRNDKYINCNSKKAFEKQLWIFEGDSAQSGFRAARNPQTQAGYIMRGVPLNITGMTPLRIMKNEVFNDIVNVLGLQWGEYNKKEDLKFNKIVVSTDMDYDGHKIASLLLVFFNCFPELFEQKLVCRALSPIIIATKGKGKAMQKKNFFTLDEYRKEENKLRGWTIKYVKGLGGQNAAEYREMMQTPTFEYFTKDKMADMMLGKWFGKGIASTRKDMLRDDVEAAE